MDTGNRSAGRGVSPRTVALVLLSCCASLVLAFAIKRACIPQESSTYPGTCYSDITALYHSRGLDSGAVPYFDFPPGGSFNDRGFLEYPVVTGLVVALTAIPSSSPASYLVWNALVLGGMALVSALLMVRAAGLAALRFAAAPALVLFAFSNWDLLAVACVAAGCVSTTQKRSGWAGFWFGIGAAAKIFPAVFVVPLLLDRIRRGDKASALRAALSFAVAFVVPNAIVGLLTDGWWVTYAFHGRRQADAGSIWGLLLPPGTQSSVTNLFATSALVIVGAAVLIIAWRKSSQGSGYPVLQTGASLLAVLILTSKIASPQQVIWLLPSFVLLDMKTWWWTMWNALALIVFAASFGVGVGPYEPGIAPMVIGLSAFLRGLALIPLIPVILWSRQRPRTVGKMVVPAS